MWRKFPHSNFRFDVWSNLSLFLSLVSCRKTGVDGTVQINEIALGSRKYSRKCSYILQDDNLYPAFTVYETMLLAANLKIAGISTGEKKIIVSRVFGVSTREKSLLKVKNIIICVQSTITRTQRPLIHISGLAWGWVNIKQIDTIFLFVLFDSRMRRFLCLLRNFFIYISIHHRIHTFNCLRFVSDRQCVEYVAIDSIEIHAMRQFVGRPT